MCRNSVDVYLVVQIGPHRIALIIHQSEDAFRRTMTFSNLVTLSRSSIHTREYSKFGSTFHCTTSAPPCFCTPVIVKVLSMTSTRDPVFVHKEKNMAIRVQRGVQACCIAPPFTFSRRS
ncbi:hypothetical protein AcV5_007555 [Taiwanofungus camphoratus]|nr:hypothetical protein AcV5_007555 [Antrodia cinnamomea]